MAKVNRLRGPVISVFQARANFSELLRQADQERRSIVIEKRGAPKAVLLSIRDYVRLAAPEPEVLQAIGVESQRKGTDKLTSSQIDRIIKAARSKRSEVRGPSSPGSRSTRHFERSEKSLLPSPPRKRQH